MHTKKIYKKRVKEIENAEVIKRKRETNNAKRETKKYLCVLWLIDARILYCANFITKKVIQGIR
jgi:hypothetical protein